MAQERLKIAKLESVGVIAGGIVHDLNNLLTGILGNLSLARLSDIRKERTGFLKAAEDASEGVKDLTLQLLTFSKGGSPVVELVDLGDLLNKAITFTMHGSSITCNLEIQYDLWMVSIDAGQINQVVNNLIINAQQAMPDGGTITVAARNIEVDSESELPIESGSYVQVSVSDEGTGVPLDDQDRIFDPFFTTKSKGSGLGLAASYSIVQAHRGHIKVISYPGEGSRFDFFVPATIEECEIEEIVDESELMKGVGTILVMDDVELIRTLAETMLVKLGFETVTCDEGEKAIELYAAALESDEPFQAIILDLTVPGGMGGKDTIVRLREIDPEVRAIVASGYSDDAIMASYSDYGFSGSLAKPYKLEELSEVLNDAIKGVSAST
jgi:CheY-like chemotaxis protein